MNNDINEKIVHAAPVPPFVRFVASAVPMVFDNSLSYYECLCALWKWMQDNLVDVINNNATVTEHYIDLDLETRALFNQLKTYVDTYFDNLDVQDEINNKLDDMAEAGTLQEIITAYIQSNVAWTFDSVADMKQATNLVDGSYARTLGFHSINDGGGALYYITNTGTANEMDIIALSDTQLVAELVPENKTIYTAQFGILGDGITDESDKLQAFFAYDTQDYIINSSNILIDDNMAISSNSRITFNKGTKIVRKATSSNAYQMLSIINKTNVEINNAHLIGDRQTHIGNEGESGHGIVVCYSQNITLKDCVVEYTWGDGYYLGESFDVTKELDPMNYLLINCRASHCSRNGFALTGGSNHKLINCSADHTDRTSPKAGLDIEPEGPNWQTISGLHNCEIINFNSSYNGTSGIQVGVIYGPAENVIINGHVSSHEYQGILYSHFNYENRNTAKSHVVYKNASISSCNHGIHIYNTDTSIDSSLLIRNVEINGSTITTGRGIWYGNQDTDNGNVTLDNIIVKNDIGLNDFQYLMTLPATRENRTISNIIVSNMSRINAPDASHYVISCDLPNGEVKFSNCNFECDIEKETASSGFLSLNAYNNVFGMNCTKNTTVKLSTTNPQGEYVVRFLNDESTPSVTHLVNFDSGNKVFYGGNELSQHYINTGARSSYVRFYKNGTNIEILDFSGYNIS